MMKKILFGMSLCLISMIFTGCTLTKHLPYFTNIDEVDINKNHTVPELRIKTNDKLFVIVSSATSEAAAPFNMNTTSGQYNTMGNQSGNLYTYIVDKSGEINFPVIGKINLVGLTRPEAEAKITSLIKPYFAEDENPIVKVRFTGFKVTVIGEVGHSNTIDIDEERISIIEALAQAGDLSVYGKRPNILLVRENSEGEKLSYRYNINDAEIFNSPYYYLEQNDIVYIEPQKSKSRSEDVNSWTFWTPVTSLALSLTTFVLSLTK